jgi:hypothetical protein
MIAQSSYFMVWGETEKPVEELIDYKYRNLCYNEGKYNIINSDDLEKFCLYRCVVPGSLKDSILRCLDRYFGINISTIAPSLDNTGEYIKSIYK